VIRKFIGVYGMAAERMMNCQTMRTGDSETGAWVKGMRGILYLHSIYVLIILL
jgi:hypothetical protein